MLQFKKRHPGPELMDQQNLDPKDLVLNLIELETINTLLGGYKTTFKGLAQLMSNKSQEYHIMDIGCGGGDTIAATHSWAQKNGFNVKFTGVDLSVTAIAQSKKRCAHIDGAKFTVLPFQNLTSTSQSFDIIMCSLFSHHFYGDDLKTLIKVMSEKSKVGFVINDLERNKIAWFSITLLTQLLSKSYLVKHDAPLSVKRGFTKAEWKSILEGAGLTNYSVQWSWAFRHCIISKNA